MATKFPKFSQALAQDPATRRIWYGIATAHDLESHDGMTEESLYQKIFASHFGHMGDKDLDDYDVDVAKKERHKTLLHFKQPSMSDFNFDINIFWLR